jgi:hypothetical protein
MPIRLDVGGKLLSRHADEFGMSAERLSLAVQEDDDGGWAALLVMVHAQEVARLVIEIV